MKVPKRFKLFGSTITVIIDNDECAKRDSYGSAVYKRDTLYLADKDYGWDFNETELESVFLHEMIHFILTRLGYNDLSGDEQFVKQVSRALHQCLTTQEF